MQISIGKGMIMKLKRIGTTSLAIVIVLLSLVIVVTPIAAQINNLNNHGNGNGAPPGGGQGSGSDAYGGQFLVIMCGSQAGYNWVESWQQGTTLADSVSQVSTCYSSLGTEYKLEISAGTKITGYYSAGGIPLKAHFIEFAVIEGQLHFSPNLKLSQPATLYKLVDGEWVKVLSFTQVLNGKAS